MAAVILCPDCQPKGTPLRIGDVVIGHTPEPRHCEGRNDQARRGLLGGVTCPCECNRKATP